MVIVEAILSFLAHLLTGSLFAYIIFLVFRNDLVTATIAERLRPAPADAPGRNEWTEAAATLAVDGVPPAVWVQALVNQMRAFETDSLVPPNRRLDNLAKRLAETRNMARWALVAQKYEQSQLAAGSARLHNKRVTTSSAVNTDETAADAGYDGDRRSSSTRVPPSRSERQTDSRGASVRPGSASPSVAESTAGTETSGRQRSSGSASSGPAAAPDGESFAGLVRELAGNVVDTIAWAKIALPACWVRAVLLWRAVRRELYSQRLRSRVEYVVGLAGRVAAINTDVDTVGGVTKVSLRLAPA